MTETISFHFPSFSQILFSQNQMPTVFAEHPTFKPTRKRRSKASRATNKTPKKRKELSQVLKQPCQRSSAVPQELLTRFPGALQRINQKIMAQNMVWLALQLEWGKDRHGVHDKVEGNIPTRWIISRRNKSRCSLVVTRDKIASSWPAICGPTCFTKGLNRELHGFAGH